MDEQPLTMGRAIGFESLSVGAVGSALTLAFFDCGTGTSESEDEDEDEDEEESDRAIFVGLGPTLAPLASDDGGAMDFRLRGVAAAAVATEGFRCPSVSGFFSGVGPISFFTFFLGKGLGAPAAKVRPSH